MNRFRDVNVLLAIVLTAVPALTHACTAESPSPFADALKTAKTAMVIRVEAIELRDPEVKDIVFIPELEAKVRVAETLFGPPVGLRRIQFTSSWCGGVNLEVGEYYVFLARDSSSTVFLWPSGRASSIVYLFGEYNETEGSTASRSRLLMYLRNYARLGSFPDTFPVEKYLKHTIARRADPP